MVQTGQIDDLERIVRRNTLILSVAMALNWAIIVLLASLTTPTIGVLFGLPGLASLGFALFLVAFAAGGLVAGRLMDALDRRTGLQAAFVVGASGAVLIYFGVGQRSIVIALVGLLIIGLGTGGANLARAAGADMYPPQRRPRGIALVPVGAAFGAIGAPIVFAPLLAGRARASLAAWRCRLPLPRPCWPRARWCWPPCVSIRARSPSGCVSPAHRPDRRPRRRGRSQS